MAPILRWQHAWLLMLFAVASTDAFMTSTHESTCREGEVSHDKVCYGLTTDVPRGFNTARQRLSGLGNDLPRVTGAVLNAKLHALLSKSGAVSAYIGLTDQLTEGDFRWTAGDALRSSDYENWAADGKGTKNYEDVSDCVVLRRSTGKWAAVNCNDDQAYFYTVGIVSGGKLWVR